jgi:hypothetical protein
MDASRAMDIANDRLGTASGIMSGTGFTAVIVGLVVAADLQDEAGRAVRRQAEVCCCASVPAGSDAAAFAVADKR